MLELNFTMKYTFENLVLNLDKLSIKSILLPACTKTSSLGSDCLITHSSVI